MINKLKIGFLIAVLSLVVGVDHASAAEINFSADTFVTVNGLNLGVTNGSVASAPFVTGGTTLTVTVPAGTFGLVSLDGYTLTNDAASPQTCSGGANTVTITGPLTVVFSPTSTVVCTAPAPSGGGGSSHSGGGGSSSSSNNNNVAISTTGEGCFAGNLFSTTTGQACGAVVVGCGAGNAFSPITGQSCGNVNINTTIVTTTNTGPFSYAFGTATIKLGSSGAGCSAWQNFFNDKMNARLVVDGKCGPLTMGAARAWQASAGLVADGLLGPMSRAKATLQGSMSTPGQ